MEWGGHDGQFSRDPLPVLSAGGPCEQFWHGQGCPFFDVVNPAFPLPTIVWPTFQGTLKDGFRVMACDMSESCKFPSLDSCQKRFLWTYQEVALAPHLVIGLVLLAGDMEKFPHVLGFKSLGPFFQSQQARSMFHRRTG